MVVFLILSGKNQISPLLVPPGKISEKSPSAPPLKKSFRRPWCEHGIRCLSPELNFDSVISDFAAVPD